MARENGESLSSKIAHHYALAVFDTKAEKFVPEGCLETLITTAEIEEELGLKNDALVAWILVNAKKVFAIAIRSLNTKGKLQRAMSWFRDTKFDDTSIPIEEWWYSEDETQHPAFPGEIWKLDNLTNFYDFQWMFLAPVFAIEQYDYDLSSQSILPVVWKRGIPNKGLFASVYQVDIHEAHQKVLSAPGRSPYKSVRRFLPNRNSSDLYP
jgi:hypothetical protein